jgi:DNA-binding CsgD family transcriptional regulator/tetratricopeptide (TPR) repeat protein
VGRARELAAVAKLIADDERTGVVLVGGEAGLGKTRLIDEMLEAHPGFAVVRGGAVPRTAPSPFELIRTTVGPLADGDLSQIAELGPMLDAARAAFSDIASDRSIPLVEQIRAAAEVLRALHQEPTLFVFDDVHWADPESLEVIDRLMAAGPPAATVLVTYRPEALRPGHPINNFLRRAERRTHALQVRLEPLRRDEVATYLYAVRGEVGERTIDRVHARTGGNPLFLSELVVAAADDTELTDGLPWTLAEILRPEIDRLPADERAVVEAVAVLGAGVPFELVAAAVQLDDDALLERLRALVDTGVLVESGPDRFDFRHELVREAVAEGLFARERRRIHAAAHDALVAMGSEDDNALVTHAEGAGRLDQAAQAARSGALRALARGSSNQAFTLAEQALLVLADDVELLRVAVIAGWLSQQYRPALDHLARWDELVRTDPVGRAEVLHWRVRLLWEVDDVAAADTAADQLADLAAGLPAGTTRAQAQADLAQHWMLSGRAAEAIAIADQAIELARAAGAASVIRQARTERATAQLFSSNTRDAGVVELQAVGSEAETAGDWIVASRALSNLPILATREPRRHLERLRTASQRAGLTCIATTGYRHNLLQLAQAEGDRAEFESLLDTALDDLDADPYVLLLATLTALDGGRIDEARDLVGRLEAADGLTDVPLIDRQLVHRLVDLVATGAVGELATVLATAKLSPGIGRIVLEHLDALLDAGLARQVRSLIGTYREGCCADRAIAGIAAELEGDLTQADAIYAEALNSSEARPVITLAQLELGRARVARARGGDQRPMLESAARRLRHWPGRLASRVAVALGAPVSDDTDPRRLTPREQEVARLVTEGRTNGGIADELFISTKTASVHVSNILSKLGMSSRAEIAAWVAAGGLNK